MCQPDTVRSYPTFSGLRLAFRYLWEDTILLVELPFIQHVNFDVGVRILRANALREMNPDDAIIIGTKPSADRVQHYFQTSVRGSLESSGEELLELCELFNVGADGGYIHAPEDQILRKDARGRFTFP